MRRSFISRWTPCAAVPAALLAVVTTLAGATNAFAAGECGEVPIELPASVDWRNHQGFSWVTPVRTQGSSCGAGWAFATTGVLESTVAWRASAPNPTMDLSEQQLLDCASPIGFDCSLGITWDLASAGPGQVVEGTGITTESCYTWSGAKASCRAMSGTCASSAVKASLVTLSSTASTGVDPTNPTFTMNEAIREEMMNCISQRPIGTMMRRYSDFDTYTGGIYEPGAGATAGAMHAVTLVGYGYDSDTHDAAHFYFIGKNSFGPSWGENGYFRIRPSAAMIGVYSFFYSYAEDAATPTFCDLPNSIRVNGADPEIKTNLTISNCGGGVLRWYASIPTGTTWLEIDDPYGNPVTTGTAIRAGTTYKVHVLGDVSNGMSTEIEMASETDGPYAITVVSDNTVVAPPDAAPTADASPVDGGTGPNPADDDDGGCSCTVGRHAPAGTGGRLVLVALGLGLAVAVRRRSR